MKKLLLPLIILLLVIGYFMSRDKGDVAGDAYDSLDQPKNESMQNTDPGAPDSSVPPAMDSDPTMPEESDDVAPTTPDPQSSGGLMDDARDAADDAGDVMKDTAEDAGDVVKDAAEDTGDAVKDAAKKAGDAVEDAGEATKDAAKDALDKIRGEDSSTDDPEPN